MIRYVLAITGMLVLCFLLGGLEQETRGMSYTMGGYIYYL